MAAPAVTTKLPFWRRTLSNVSSKLKIASNDYSAAVKQLGEDIRTYPGRTACWVTVIGLSGYIASNVPNTKSYRTNLTNCIADIGMIPGSVRNAKSYDYLMRMAELKNEGRLRVQNYLFFSLLHRVDFNPGVSTYQSQVFGLGMCNPFKTFKDGIEDFGWMGQWYNLELAMKDYDVND